VALCAPRSQISTLFLVVSARNAARGFESHPLRHSVLRTTLSPQIYGPTDTVVTQGTAGASSASTSEGSSTFHIDRGLRGKFVVAVV